MTPADFPQSPTSDAATHSAWSVEEIDRLYRQALEAVDAVANDLNAATDALTNEAESEPSASTVGPTSPGPELAVQNAQPKAKTDNSTQDGPVGPEQVIEALLFVGGKPMTIKAIGSVLHGEFEPTFIETAIEQLRDRYSEENRPYEIGLVDGGYRLALRPEFEAERNRAYGFGPRQVRLSQDTLEVLSLVAYRQPISRRSIEEIGKRGAGSHLRQLLQRELIVLDRPEGSDGDVTYRTSSRFLQLFGLRRLEELPQIEDLEFK